MKHISQLTTLHQPASAEPTRQHSKPKAGFSTLTPLRPGQIANVWTHMAGIFGHPWISNHGVSDESGTWARGLAGLTPEQLATGLARCIEVGTERVRKGEKNWPPTLPEFRAMCLPAKRATAAHSEAGGLLPAPRADKDKALSEMGKILGMLA